MKGGAEKKIKGGFRPSRGARVTSVRVEATHPFIIVRPLLDNTPRLRRYYIFRAKRSVKATPARTFHRLLLDNTP